MNANIIPVVFFLVRINSQWNDLIVLPSYQGSGIGTRILDEITDKCRSLGIPDIQLFCARGKAGFYEKHGFARRPADGPGMELKWDPLHSSM